MASAACLLRRLYAWRAPRTRILALFRTTTRHELTIKQGGVSVNGDAWSTLQYHFHDRSRTAAMTFVVEGPEGVDRATIVGHAASSSGLARTHPWRSRRAH